MGKMGKSCSKRFHCVLTLGWSGVSVYMATQIFFSFALFLSFLILNLEKPDACFASSHTFIARI